MKPMDDAAGEEGAKNMKNLVDVGTKLLQMPVAGTDMDSGDYYGGVAGKDDTNNEALQRFAEMLSNERKLRLKNEREENTFSGRLWRTHPTRSDP